MAEDEKQELDDILIEETTRGKRRPKKAVSLARERVIRRVMRLLADPNSDKETFLETIREYGLRDESAEFRQLLALWRKRHGNP